tara:strand:- start:265 stop:627 length:363 start_codon:yes stop_codon:yes gene_type:complete
MTADAMGSYTGGPGGDFNYGRAFNESWGGRNWMDRVGLGQDFGQTDDDLFDYNEDTDVNPDTPTDTPTDDVGFGGAAVGGKSDPSLKRRSRSSKNRLRKMMRKDLAIPTGRKVINVPGAS